MELIPASLAPFFQEYDIKKLSPERDSHTVIERVLQFGNRSEIRWLFSVYTQERISGWIGQFGEERLPQPHLDFWRIVLSIGK